MPQCTVGRDGIHRFVSSSTAEHFRNFLLSDSLVDVLNGGMATVKAWEMLSASFLRGLVWFLGISIFSVRAQIQFETQFHDMVKS